MMWKFIIIAFILSACGTKVGNEKTILVENKINDSADVLVTDTTNKSVSEEMATYFVLVADTSMDYYLLQRKLFKLNKLLKLPIDTMGRYYNTTKKLIALPDTSSDEIYAGQYYPRRYPSDNLSLEYLNYYQNKGPETTLALVTGIYGNTQEAESALTPLKKIEKNAFIVKANIYIGCMH